MVQGRAIVTTEHKLGSRIYFTVPFPLTLNVPNLGFKVTVLFKSEYYANWCILYGPTA